MWNPYLFQHSRAKSTQKNGNSCISPLTWNKRHNSDVGNASCCRKCLFIWLRKLQQANDTRTRICGGRRGGTIWRGNGVRVKKKNDQRTPSLSLEKLPLFVHMLRGFFLTVCECWPDASEEKERGGRKQSTKKQKTCDRLQHIRGKI